jgi:hypothetical protein
MDDRWIPISKALPDTPYYSDTADGSENFHHSNLVLVYAPKCMVDGDQTTAFMNLFRDGRLTWNGFDGYEVKGITHWQPLGPPPQE